MNKLIVALGLLLSLSAFAQNETLEAGWKTKGRSFVSSIAGTNLAEKLFGAAPVATVTEAKLPEIPKQVRKNTDVESYTKLQKAATEYDKLPNERKRQFDYKFLQELFQVTRKAEAKDEDLSNWLNVLDQGGSREGIYQALVLDEVYAAMEDMEERPSEKLLNFSLNFSQRFLNQTFKKETLEQLNLYSIKRILTEKALDLIEHYEVHSLDNLNEWYAIFSSELARDYGDLLRNEVRQEKSAEYHLEWAKSMPVQHIKSEFIIKLHGVMNGLQLVE